MCWKYYFLYSGKYVIRIYFFHHYWELINVHHCTSLRCITWWSDLRILWNDYQNTFSKGPSSERNGKRRSFLVMRTLTFHSLTGFPTCHTSGWAKAIMLHINYIPSTYISYICTFLPPSSSPSPNTLDFW